MREMSSTEIQSVDGGLSFTEGGIAIVGLAVCSPVTAPLALIGLACMYVGYYQDNPR